MNSRERYIRFYTICMFLVLALLPVLGISSAEAPQVEKPTMEITGFYTEAEGSLPSSFSSLSSNAKNISVVAPFYYRIDKQGGVEKWDGVSEEQVKILTAYAKERNVKVLALVHNLLYGKSGIGKKRAQAVLKDYHSRERFAGEVTQMVTESGYDGVMLDIEDIRNRDRDKFSALVKQMKEKFADRNLTVAVTVPPETGESVK
ncbi:MAG TPA: glycosyl hydrolase family 18 protein, partial [Desulfobacteria bacterium]|nr:glycosyl hydrolase family 18 protein [Desulfobacteria bacterium]